MPGYVDVLLTVCGCFCPRYETGNEVLKGVSFAANAGEITAIVGPSGATRQVHRFRFVPRLVACVSVCAW